MKRRTIEAVFAAILLTACASAQTPPPPGPQGRPGEMGSERPGFGMRGMNGGGLDMLPPSGWWNDEELAGPVKLTKEQKTKLDASNLQADELRRLSQDSMTAAKELRALLEKEAPAPNELTAAAAKLRTLRDEMFDLQVKRLLAERAILTSAQWTSLQKQLQNRMPVRRPGAGREPMSGMSDPRTPGWP